MGLVPEWDSVMVDVGGMVMGVWLTLLRARSAVELAGEGGGAVI